MLQQPSAIMPSRRRCGAWKQLRLGLCAVMLTLILCPPLPCLCQFPPFPPVKTVIQPPLFEGKVRGGFCAPPSHHTAPSAHVRVPCRSLVHRFLWGDCAGWPRDLQLVRGQVQPHLAVVP